MVLTGYRNVLGASIGGTLGLNDGDLRRDLLLTVNGRRFPIGRSQLDVDLGVVCRVGVVNGQNVDHGSVWMDYDFLLLKG